MCSSGAADGPAPASGQRLLVVGGIQGRVPSLAANAIQVMKMAGAFSALGHQVTLVVPRGPRRVAGHTTRGVDPFEFHGIRDRFAIHRVRVVGDCGRAALVTFAHAVRRLARRQAWDVVFCRNAMASIALARGGVHHLFEAHHFRLAGRVDRWHLPIVRSPLVGRLVVLGGAVRDAFVEAGVDAGKIRVEPDGTDLPEAPATPAAVAAGRRQLRTLAGRPGDDPAPVALYAGSLGPLKGTDLLLEVAALLPAVQFVLVGDGAPGRLDAYRARATALPNVHLPGPVAPVAVGPLLQAADAVLVPHGRASERRYTSPLKIFEAMAAGRPIVASDLAATREVLEDGASAMLVEPDVPQAFAAALRRVLEAPDLAGRLATTARQRVVRHTWQQRARRIVAAAMELRAPRRRRLVHVINSFHPLVGGAERQAAALARCQQEAGDQVEIVTRRRSGLPPLDGVGPLLVRRLGQPALRGPGFLVAALVHLLRNHRGADVVHAHQARAPALVAVLARRVGGPPAVVKLAGLDLPRGRGPLTALRRRALAAADAVVATQPAMAAALAGLGLERLELIPNGVDADHFAPLKAPAAGRRLPGLEGAPALPRVLFVGRLEPVKGIDLLLEAWRRRSPGAPAAHLVIAGDGSLAGPVRDACGPTVSWIGTVDDPAALYRAVDLLVVPSRSEGLSNVLLEGMATGLAVVASAVGGNPSLITDGVDGCLVEAENVAALGGAVDALLADAARRAVLGRAARRTIERDYRLERIEARWAALYAGLLASGSRPAKAGTASSSQSIRSSRSQK